LVNVAVNPECVIYQLISWHVESVTVLERTGK